MSSKPKKPRLKSSTKLEPHQQRALDKLRASGGLILAHQLGGGKTLTSIAAGIDSGLPLEVIAPAPLLANYEKEVDKHVDGSLPRRLRSYAKITRDASLQKDNLDRNALVVLDEAHRLRNPGTKLHKFVAGPAMEARQRLLLTGTPVYNQPQDIAVLGNIAAGEKRLPEDYSEFKKKFIGETVTQPGFLQKLRGMKPGSTPKLLNHQALEDALAGHIDIHEGAKENFPDRKDENIDVPLSERQHKIYKYLEGSMPGHIRRKIRSGLPPSKQESKDLNAYVSGVRQSSLSPRPYVHGMTDEEEEQHIPKIQRAVQELHKHHTEDPNFRGVVYSNYLSAGLDPYSRQLKKLKVPHHKFTGSVPKHQRAQMVRDYNEGKVPVLLVSSSGTEGLDLKGTKLMQVMEPHFNSSKIDQVIGRGIRFKSHTHLPEEERSVKVQRFHSTIPKGRMQRWFGAAPDKSIEQFLTARSGEKDQMTAQMRDVFRKAHDRPPMPTQEKTSAIAPSVEKVAAVYTTAAIDQRVWKKRLEQAKLPDGDGCSLKQDEKGYYVYTHRARSKSHASPDKIPLKAIRFIGSTA